MIKRILIAFCTAGIMSAAGQGYFSGEFQSNVNVFVRDTTIGAKGSNYDNLKSGTDNWFTLNYNNTKYDLEASVRMDFFYNSILHTPTVPYTGFGLGRAHIKKRIKDFTVQAGYIYDQYGSGVAFRAYEERSLGIDNAVIGAKVDYNYKDKIRVKAFAGVQKWRFTFYKPILKGINIDGDFAVKEKVFFQPGISFFNRTLDKESMDETVKVIESYETEKRFVPKYNVFVFSGYNTLRYKGFSWYIEGAYKTKDAIRNAKDTLVNTDGNYFYTSVNYSKKGFGITAQFKRTENFTLRTSQNERLLRGMLNFIPPVARQNSLRLPARYFAPSLELRELAFGAEATIGLPKNGSMILNYSEIRDFILKETNNPYPTFFREAFVEVILKPIKKMELDFGIQYVRYNKIQYRQEPPADVDAITPFFELVYKFDRKKSIRTELQYQYVPKDYGQWIFALIEFNIAPRWSFAVSDMYLVKPNLHEYPQLQSEISRHYYSAFVGFTHHSTKFTIAYVRQVEGIVCTGGVCRVEPAFNGLRMGITTTF